MGWANCGEDSKGRPIGYSHEAICDHPGCNKIIHRGLAYACGGMHGQNGWDCDGYFCEEHLRSEILPDGTITQLCEECANALAPHCFECGSTDITAWDEMSDDGELIPVVYCHNCKREI